MMVKKKRKMKRKKRERKKNKKERKRKKNQRRKHRKVTWKQLRSSNKNKVSKTHNCHHPVLHMQHLHL